MEASGKFRRWIEPFLDAAGKAPEVEIFGDYRPSDILINLQTSNPHGFRAQIYSQASRDPCPEDYAEVIASFILQFQSTTGLAYTIQFGLLGGKLHESIGFAGRSHFAGFMCNLYTTSPALTGDEAASDAMAKAAHALGTSLLQATEAHGWFDKDDRLWQFWGPNGELDIEKEWPYYFDTEEEYMKLRNIKSKVDPCNIFRNGLTIPPICTGNK